MITWRRESGGRKRQPHPHSHSQSVGLTRCGFPSGNTYEGQLGARGHVLLPAPFQLLPSSFRVASCLPMRKLGPQRGADSQASPRSLWLEETASWGTAPGQGGWAGAGFSCRGRSSAGMLGAPADAHPPWSPLARGRPSLGLHCRVSQATARPAPGAGWCPAGRVQALGTDPVRTGLHRRLCRTSK